MSVHSIFQNFAEGFSVKGIFIQTPQEIFPVFQEKSDLLLIIKRHSKLQNGINDVKYENINIGALVDPLNEKTNIIIIAEIKNINEIAAHWKRFSPVIKNQINVEEFVQKESIETKLINSLEEIRVSLSNTNKILKEKMNLDK